MKKYRTIKKRPKKYPNKGNKNNRNKNKKTRKYYYITSYPPTQYQSLYVPSPPNPPRIPNPPLHGPQPPPPRIWIW
jgi:hypothetical protein